MYNATSLYFLYTGRCSYTRKLHSVADKVQWSTDGTRYLLNYSESVGVHDAATNQCTATVTRNVESSQSSTAINKRVNKAMFVNEDGVSNAVLILYESKHIGLVSSTGEEVCDSYYCLAVISTEQSTLLFLTDCDNGFIFTGWPPSRYVCINQ